MNCIHDLPVEDLAPHYVGEGLWFDLQVREDFRNTGMVNLWGLTIG
jgi:hypothetical protein